MRRKIKNKKISLSITLEPTILKVVNENYSNRSKFLENLIIEELSKNSIFEQRLKDKKIIL